MSCGRSSWGLGTSHSSRSRRLSVPSTAAVTPGGDDAESGYEVSGQSRQSQRAGKPGGELRNTVLERIEPLDFRRDRFEQREDALPEVLEKGRVIERDIEERNPLMARQRGIASDPGEPP